MGRLLTGKASDSRPLSSYELVNHSRCAAVHGKVYRLRQQALRGVDGPPVRYEVAEREQGEGLLLGAEDNYRPC
jgi:hypothetical protein